jgi:hypothetical protein
MPELQTIHSRPPASAPNPAFLVIAALWILWGFGFETVWDRLTSELDGTIVSRQEFPSTAMTRYGTEYVVRGANGRDQVYTAGPSDASLARGMPVGTRITKRRWELGYERNGTWVGFPIAFYSGVFGVAAACLVAAFWQCRIRWLNGERERVAAFVRSVLRRWSG